MFGVCYVDLYVDLPGGARKSIHLCCFNGYGDCMDVKYGNGTLRGTIGVSY